MEPAKVESEPTYTKKEGTYDEDPERAQNDGTHINKVHSQIGRQIYLQTP